MSIPPSEKKFIRNIVDLWDKEVGDKVDPETGQPLWASSLRRYIFGEDRVPQIN